MQHPLHQKYPCYKDDSKHIESEFLANKLYNLAGVQTADVKLVYMSGNKVCLASKFQEGLKPLNIQEAQRAFAVDAWLANWDGVLSENTMSVGGSCLKIDCGGSLRYRAMGGLKPQFGDQVDELLTLLSHKNSGSASVYHNMSRETAINSLKKAMDYKEYGGALFLGVKKPVVKAHGSSDEKLFEFTIKQAEQFVHFFGFITGVFSKYLLNFRSIALFVQTNLQRPQFIQKSFFTVSLTVLSLIFQKTFLFY